MKRFEPTPPWVTLEVIERDENGDLVDEGNRPFSEALLAGGDQFTSAIGLMWTLQFHGWPKARQVMKDGAGRARIVLAGEKNGVQIWMLKAKPSCWRLYFHVYENSTQFLFLHSYCKKKLTKTPGRKRKRAESSTALAPVPQILVRSGSSSPIRKAFKENPDLQLAWDNEVAFHVARNLLLLRKRREQSQSELATSAGTSQGRVARIESALDNITLKTLKKLVTALNGRFKVSISPAEVTIPFCPDWWDWLAVDGGAAHWTFHKAALADHGDVKVAAIAWIAASDYPSFPVTEPSGAITLTLTEGETCNA